MKNRKQKHSEYEQKFGNIPIDYKERLSWMYDQYKITDRQALEIIDKRDMLISSFSYIDTQIILFEIPEGSPRPRFRLINRSNISNMAMSNPNWNTCFFSNS